MSKYYVFIFAAVIVSAFSQMLLKLGAGRNYDSFIKQYLNWPVMSGYILMFLSTVLIILAYRGLEYKEVPMLESLGFILVMVLGRIFFKEKITKNKVIGMAAIVLGIAVFYM